MKNSEHCDERRQKYMNTYFAAKKIGIDSTDIEPKIRTNIYKCFCRSTLYYGIECFNLNQQEIKKTQRTESNIIKQILNIKRRTKSTQLMNAIYIEPARLAIDIIKCKFFKRLLQYELTSELIENIYQQRVGEKRVTGKWANYISEMIDICNRGLENELVAEKQANKSQINQSQNITINKTLNENNNLNLTKNIPDLESLTRRVDQLLNKLTKNRNSEFKTGTADTIRFLLASKHFGNKESSNSLNLFLRAFEPRDNNPNINNSD